MMRRKQACISYLLLLLCCWQGIVKAQAVRALSSVRDIAFAGGLLDWQNKPVDSLRCDIYYPPGATSDKKYPLILSCHAGSFIGGSKAGQVSGADALSDMGFIVVAPDYRIGYDEDIHSPCSDDTTGQNMAVYRAQQDGSACMRFLYHYADSFHIDTNNLFLMGNSAGADLALHMHYITDSVAKLKYPYAYKKLGGVQSSGNSFPFSYKIKGICAMWGGLPNWDLVTPASAVPMIMFKGGLDPGLPEGSGHYKKCPNYVELIAGIGLYNVMTGINKPCVYHYQPNGFHAAYDEEFCDKATNSFFRAVMKNQAYTGYYLYYQQSW